MSLQGSRSCWSFLILVILIFCFFPISNVVFRERENIKFLEAPIPQKIFEEMPEEVDSTGLDQNTKATIVQQFSRLQSYFIENQGQLNNTEIKYYFQGQNFWVGFTPQSVIFGFSQSEDPASLNSSLQRIQVRFEKALPVIPQGLEPLSHLTNFLRIKNNSQNTKSVSSYTEILYRDLYPEIDLKYKFDEEGNLKYEFIVHPGGDPNQIHVNYKGVSGLQVENEALTVTLGSISFEERELFIFQEEGEEITPISGYFTSRGAFSFGFELEGKYNPNLPLVIDPTIEFSTYVGSLCDDRFYYSRGYECSIALDANNNAFITGYTIHSVPITPGAFDSTYNGNTDAFVIKLSKDGSSLVYATYLGGSSEDSGVEIAVDTSGNAYIMGSTWSSDFPTTSGAFDTTHNGNKDVFLTKLNGNGSILLYSTFLGGNGHDNVGEIVVDTSGNAHLIGATFSTNFPTTSGAFDSTSNGNIDVFVSKLSTDGSSLEYSTLLGGESADWGYGIALDTSGNAYITGKTLSQEFPITSGALDSIHNGKYDIFVTKLSANGSSLEYSTYYGGTNDDLAKGIAIDPRRNVYITGSTRSRDFPTSSGAYDTSFNGGGFLYGRQEGGDVFVVKFSSLNFDLIYSTFLGGKELDLGNGIDVDFSGICYIVGFTDSRNFPVVSGGNRPTTDEYGFSGPDGFMTRLNPNGSLLLFSTYLGGPNTDEAFDVVINDTGSAFIAGYTMSNIPTTSGAYSTSPTGVVSGFVIKYDFKMAPGAPTSLQTTTGMGYINLSWTTPSTDGGTEITAYNIYRGMNKENLEIISSVNSSIKQYTDWNISGGLILYYDIRATNSVGEGLGFTEVNMTQHSVQYGVFVAANSPLNGSYLLTNSTIDLNVTDPNLDVTFYHWDSELDQTFTPPYNLQLPGDEGWHSLHIFANDTSGRETLKTFMFYCDRSAPLISLLSTTNGSHLGPNTVLTLNVTEPSIQSVVYSWDLDSNISIQAPYQVPLPLVEGWHDIFVYANDTLGHESSALYHFWIDHIPFISLQLLDNESSILPGITLAFSITDINLTDVLYRWDNSSTSTISFPFQIPVVTQNGWHWLYILANDTEGNLARKNFLFFVDAKGPSTKLTALSNGTSILPGEEINFIVSDQNLEGVWCSWDSETIKYGISSYKINTSEEEGWHKLQIWANDTFGHISSVTYVFWVNYPPSIFLLSQLIGSQTSIDSSIHFLVIDSNLSRVYYQWDADSNRTLQLPYQVNTINQSGWHYLKIFAIDAHGAQTKAMLRIYVVHADSIEIQEEDRPQTTYERENFEFSFKVTNTNDVSLNLTLFAYSKDDDVLEGNGTKIILNPEESHIFILEVRPKHASPHDILVRLFSGDSLYKEFNFSFEVQPFFFSPRVLGPLFFAILIVIVFSILVLASIFIKSKLDERDRLKWAQEEISTKGPLDLETLKAKFTDEQVSKVTDYLREGSFQVGKRIISYKWLEQEIRDLTIREGSVTTSKLAAELNVPVKRVKESSEKIHEVVLYKEKTLLSLENAQQLVLQNVLKKGKKNLRELKKVADELKIPHSKLQVVIADLLKSQQLLGVIDTEFLVWYSPKDITQIRVDLEIPEVADVVELAKKKGIPVELFIKFLKEVVKPHGYFSEDGKFVSKRAFGVELG